MPSHILKSTLRNFTRDPWFPLVVLLGLTIALGCSFTALIHLFNELSYDSHHHNRDRICKVLTYDSQVTSLFEGAPFNLYSAIAEGDIPQVEHAAIVMGVRGLMVLDREGNPIPFSFQPRGVSPDLFNILTFDFLYGTGHAIEDPGQVVMSRSAARYLFPGMENPVGENVDVRIGNHNELFMIGGIFEDSPALSTYSFEILFNYASFPEASANRQWTTGGIPMYVMLARGLSPEQAGSALNSLLPDEFRQQFEFRLHQMSDFYFKSGHILNWRGKTGNKQVALLLSGIAILTLFIAVANNVLFLAARFSSRTRELGIRKVIGAGKVDIIKLPVAESVILTLAAFLLSVMLIELFLPQMTSFFRNGLHYSTLANYSYVLGLALLGMLLAVTAGWIAGTRFSAAGPVSLISGNYRPASRKGLLGAGRIVLILQVAILTGMLSASGFIIVQLNHMINISTGYDREKILKIILGAQNSSHYQPLNDRISLIPGVESVSGAFAAPPGTHRLIAEAVNPDDQEVSVTAYNIIVDHGFFETMGIGIADGRSFSADHTSDLHNALVMNRAAVRSLGLEDPVGKVIGEKTIIGICDDFFMNSIHQPVEPMIFYLAGPQLIHEILIRYENERLGELLDGISRVWEEFEFQAGPVIHHPSETIRFWYREEENLRKLVLSLTLLSGVIAVSGLSALAVFTARRRMKEIGIRKVNGATTADIFRVWSLEYLGIVAAGLFISTPVIWFFLNRWLQNFVCSSFLSWWVFIPAGLLTATVVWVSTAIQTYRAALRNPVNLLRYE